MMRFHTALTAVPALSLAILVIAFRPAIAQSTFAAASSSVRFSLPDGWKAEEQGATVRISTPDGVAWTLKRDDAVAKEMRVEAPRSVKLREAAKLAAQGTVQGPQYVGVKPLTVVGGSGAVFRFRGQGKKGADDLVEVWAVVSDKRGALLSPDTAPQPDYTYELNLLMKSLSLGESGKGAPTADIPAQPSGRRSDERQAVKDAGPEMERYEGHLVQGDVYFRLHLFGEERATAEWERTVGTTARYQGSYSGSEGNYVVKLDPASGDAANASPLNLTLRSLGGMVKATYTSGGTAPSRTVSELKLMGVYAPNIKLRGTSASRARSQNLNRNTSQQSMRTARNTLRAGQRMMRNTRTIVRRAAQGAPRRGQTTNRNRNGTQGRRPL